MAQLKLPWNDKPVTPKYLKEYEFQKALVHEFYEYQGVYDGLGEYHKYHGNGGKYHHIFNQEIDNINAKHREETRRRFSRVTTGHTPAKRKPNRSITNNPPRRKKIYRD